MVMFNDLDISRADGEQSLYFGSLRQIVLCLWATVSCFTRNVAMSNRVCRIFLRSSPIQI